jgi:hypothetical protein
VTATLTVAGSGGYAAPVTQAFPNPANLGLQIAVAVTAQEPWLIACISWNQPHPGWVVTSTTGTTTSFTTAYEGSEYIYAGDWFTALVENVSGGTNYYVTNVSAPSSGNVVVTFTPSATTAFTTETVYQNSVTMSVADDAHNWWFPLSSTSEPAGVTRTAIWASPTVRPAVANVLIEPSGFTLSMAATIYQAAGISTWSQASGSTYNYVNQGSELILGRGAPSAQSLVITTTGNDYIPATITLTGSGWSATETTTADNGEDHTEDIVNSSAWQVTSSSTTATWTSSTPVDFSGVTVTLPVAANAPTQPNPNWPYMVTEVALGAGPGTPADQLTWTALAQPSSTRTRVLGMNLSQGKQYMLDQLQAGQGTVVLDDPDLVLIPPGSGAFAGIDSGTPFRVRAAWNGGSWQVQVQGNGSVNNPGVVTQTNLIPVTANTEYPFSLWSYSPQGWSGGVQIGVNWYTSGGGYISSSFPAPVTCPAGVVQLLAGTEESPAGAAFAQVVYQAYGVAPFDIIFYAAAAPSQAQALTAWPGIIWSASAAGVTSSILAPWNPDRRGPPVVSPWFIPMAGYFQRWPPTWDPDTYRGRTEATIADAWAYMNRQLKSCLRQEMLSDGPYAYWPLSDAAGAPAATNIAPGNTNTLNVDLSKLGTDSVVTQAFGQNSGALLGDSVTTITTSQRSSSSQGMWGQTAVPGGASNNFGYALQCTDPGFPSIAAGVTVTGFFQCTAATIAVDAHVFNLSSTTQTGIVGIYINAATGLLYLQYTPTTGTTYGVEISGSDFRNATTPTHFAVTFNQTSYIAYVNGVAFISGTFIASLTSLFSTLSVGGIATAVATGGFYDNYSAHIGVYPYQVAPERIQSWYFGGIYAFGAAVIDDTTVYSDADSDRVERLLGYTGYTGNRCILQGTAINHVPQDYTPMVSCQDIGGQPGATSLTNVASSTIPGDLYVAPNGDVFYLQKSYAYNQPVMWVLGDDAPAGEIPMMLDYTPDYDPARVVNDIQITQLDDQSVTIPDVPFTEQVSANQYGDQTYTATGYLAYDLLSTPPAGPGIQDLADWIAEADEAPHLRVAQATVDGASHPAAWQFVLQASVGDLATVNIRPVTSGGQLVSITGRITQTTRTFTFGNPSAGTCMCLIDSAPEASALTADSPTFGLLNGTNVIGW